MGIPFEVSNEKCVEGGILGVVEAATSTTVGRGALRCGSRLTASDWRHWGSVRLLIDAQNSPPDFCASMRRTDESTGLALGAHRQRARRVCGQPNEAVRRPPGRHFFRNVKERTLRCRVSVNISDKCTFVKYQPLEFGGHEPPTSTSDKLWELPAAVVECATAVRSPSDLLEPIEIPEADWALLLRARHVARQVELNMEIVGQVDAVDDGVGLVNREDRVVSGRRRTPDDPTIRNRPRPARPRSWCRADRRPILAKLLRSICVSPQGGTSEFTIGH
jgi:hypothetical protein